MKKTAFILGFTGTLLTGLIVKMPFTNADDAPLCAEGENVAIAAASGETYLTGSCTLNKDFSGNLVVGDNITATLNLNGKTVSSTTGVTLKNLGHLTVTGEGAVIGSNNYTVQNQNTMRIEGGTYSTIAEIKTNSGPSLVANGWDLTSAIGATPKDKPAGAANYATLEIVGGNFNGGLNNVKNDENGILKISGGTFEDPVGQKTAVLHGGKSLEITGGTLKNRVYVQSMGVDKAKSLAVSGGTISSIAFEYTAKNIDPEVYHDVRLTGGTFSINLPGTVHYSHLEAHDFSGSSFAYAGSSDIPSLTVDNIHLTGGFSINNGDLTEVILKNSTVSQFSSINKGSLDVIDVDATSGGYIKVSNGTVNIYDGFIGQAGKMITTTKNNHGTINIYDGFIYGTLTPTNGTINAFGGKFLENSEALQAAVENANAIAGTENEIIEIEIDGETWYYVGTREESSTASTAEGHQIDFETPVETLGHASLVVIPTSDEDLAELQASIENLKTAYDITLFDDLGHIVPVENNKLRVKLALDGEHQGYDHYSVVYLDNTGAVAEKFDATAEDGTLTFETTHLSLYGVIAYNDPDEEPDDNPADDPTDDDGKTDDNTDNQDGDGENTPDDSKDNSGSEEETVIIIDDDTDGPAVPNTSDTTPTVPNTDGYSSDANTRASALLWTLGFVAVTIAGVLAIIKKNLGKAY